MNNIAYKNRIPSPFQVARKPYYKKEMPKDTVQEEINKLLGTYQFSATFEEDTQTANTLKHIPGIIAFVCTIKKGDKVIGQGRGTTVINQMNRFIVRTINYAFNASLVDGIIRSTKILDAFRPDATPHAWSGADETSSDVEVSDIATPKQVDYLRQLIQLNCEEDEREGWLSQLSELTKEEASQAIQRFAK
jgi:hypothetical protein